MYLYAIVRWLRSYAYGRLMTSTSGVLHDLDLPLSSLMDNESDLPLPNFTGQTVADEDEDHYMHFLAQVSLSRLMNRIRSFHATINIDQLTMNFEPARLGENSPLSENTDTDHRPLRILIYEMDRQLEEWRVHLPAPLKWNNDHTAEMPNADTDPSPLDPLFIPSGALNMPLKQFHNLETLIAVLRSRYLHARYLIWLPVLYKVLHFPDQMIEGDVESCTIFLKVLLFL